MSDTNGNGSGSVGHENIYPAHRASGQYVKEVGFEQAKFVATAMDHGGLLDWESTDHDKQEACAVAIAKATTLILGIRGFIACGAENEPEKEEPEQPVVEEPVQEPVAETTDVADGGDPDPDIASEAIPQQQAGEGNASQV